MKPSDKEKLIRSRPALIRSLELDSVLPLLKRPNMYSQADEDRIMADPRRRERVTIFLNIMERKPTETFQAFCEILENQYPHLFLQLTDWERDDDDDTNDWASSAKLDDDWSSLHRRRDYLINAIDAARIAPQLLRQNVLSEEEEQRIGKDGNMERRTEILLDILEMKPSEMYGQFLEIVSDIYPHVYLELTSDGQDEDW